MAIISRAISVCIIVGKAFGLFVVIIVVVIIIIIHGSKRACVVILVKEISQLWLLVRMIGIMMGTLAQTRSQPWTLIVVVVVVVVVVDDQGCLTLPSFHEASFARNAVPELSITWTSFHEATATQGTSYYSVVHSCVH